MIDYFSQCPIKTIETPPLKLQPWLNHQGSFMRRLKEHGIKQPEVMVLNHAWQFPTETERQLLAIKSRCYALIREVLIKSEEGQWMVARTVFPKTTLTGAERQLIYLNNRSLGSVLFKNPHLERTPFEFFCIQVEQLLWARRSLFTLHNKSILLAEIFLPDMLCL